MNIIPVGGHEMALHNPNAISGESENVAWFKRELPSECRSLLDDESETSAP
jgi:hypothetical protein